MCFKNGKENNIKDGWSLNKEVVLCYDKTGMLEKLCYGDVAPVARANALHDT